MYLSTYKTKIFRAFICCLCENSNEDGECYIKLVTKCFQSEEN